MKLIRTIVVVAIAALSAWAALPAVAQPQPSGLQSASIHKVIGSAVDQVVVMTVSPDGATWIVHTRLDAGCAGLAQYELQTLPVVAPVHPSELSLPGGARCPLENQVRVNGFSPILLSRTDADRYEVTGPEDISASVTTVFCSELASDADAILYEDATLLSTYWLYFQDGETCYIVG